MEERRGGFEFEADDRDWLSEDVAEQPYWTPARVLYMLIILITLLALLTYTLWPLINLIANPPPPPTLSGPSYPI